MENFAATALAAVSLLVALPILVGLLSSKRIDRDKSNELFLFNRGQNDFVATLAGAVSGNIGIGSFLALFLFAGQSPVIAFSVVGAYTFGLVLCALLAPLIRDAGQRSGTLGLVDLISGTHEVKNIGLVWFPVCVVFVLRSAVQLGALGFIMSGLFGGNTTLSIAICAGLLGGYLFAGGYRAAVQTDIVQALVVVAGVAICAFGLERLDGNPASFFSLGEYKAGLLVGIWLFIPFSAVLAVDNWQRITVAKSTRIARRAYFVAAFVCCGAFLLIALVGYRAPAGSTMYDAFNLVLPSGFEWIALAMFIACIMSSVDTFVMPLVASVGKDKSIVELRTIVAALVFVTAVAAILFSDTLENVIAAFNSLSVFLPAAFGALFFKNARPSAAIWSMNTGLIAAIALTLVDKNIASLVGFAVSAGLYVLLHRIARGSGVSHPNE